jgi:ABC-2 type transport system permease protein
MRARIWVHNLRRSTPHLVAFVVAAIGTALVLAVLVPSLWLLRDEANAVRAVTVPLLSTLTLLWGVLSIAASGTDRTLDPADFATLPVRGAQLAPGLIAAAFVGLPAVLTTGIAVGAVGTWSADPAGLAAAVLATPIGLLTAVLLSRVLTASLARVLSGRRGRIIGAFAVSVVTMTPFLFNVLLLGRRSPLDPIVLDLEGPARVAGWTPFGWAWALPLDAARGDLTGFAAHALLALALVTGLGVAWVRLVDGVLTRPDRTSAGERVRTGIVLPRLLGTSPVAAVALRRIQAWRRDTRLVSIAMRTFLLPVLLIGQALFFRGTIQSASLGVFFLAVFCGLTLMNDLAFDGPSWWMHIATGLPGTADRLARVIASTVVFGPVLVLAYAACVALDLLAHPVGFLGVALCGLFCGLGLAAWVGAITPGSAPRAGSDPFAARSGAGAAGCLTAIVSMVGPLLLASPVGIAYAFSSHSPAADLLLLVLGIGWGVVVTATGVFLGGRHLDRTAPEMLQRLHSAQI